MTLTRLLGTGAALAALLGAAPTPAPAQTVVRIPVTGEIENGLAPFVARALAEAKAEGAAAAILDLDTPGGRVDAAERISDAVRGAGIPVYAWVHPRAYSAGALIALSAEAIYMTPGGVMGAATPVDGSGTKASEKMVSAMRAEFRALAEQRGRDPRYAEKMVDESLDLAPLAPAGKLLTLSTQEALAIGYAAAEAADEAALLAGVGLAGARIVTVERNWAERVVGFLTSPLVSPLLLSLGVLGLMLELKAGAFGVGGAVSLASLGLFFGSSMLLGLAGLEEVILLGVGLIALGVEVFLLPGFGVAGFIGVGCLGGATVLAMLGASPTASDVTQAIAILGASLVITAAVAFAWIRHLPNSPRWRRYLLLDGMTSEEGYLAAPARAELVGREGTALTDLRPSGSVELDGERLDVVTEGEYLPRGSRVRIVRAESFRHVVRAAG